MKRLLIMTAMVLGLFALAAPNSAEAGRWHRGYRSYYPGYYYGGYYRTRPYRNYYYRGYRPYRQYGYYNYGWGPRGYVSTPWFGVGW